MTAERLIRDVLCENEVKNPKTTQPRCLGLNVLENRVILVPKNPVVPKLDYVRSLTGLHSSKHTNSLYQASRRPLRRVEFMQKFFFITIASEAKTQFFSIFKSNQLSDRMLWKNCVLIFFTVVGIGASQRCDTSKCPTTPKHYEELGCSPIRKSGECCPSRWKRFKSSSISWCSNHAFATVLIARSSTVAIMANVTTRTSRSAPAMSCRTFSRQTRAREIVTATTIEAADPRKFPARV